MSKPTAASWGTAAAVKAAAQTAWDAGHVLRELHQSPQERTHFPRRVRLSGPKSTDLAQRLFEVSTWARGLRTAASTQGWRLETRPMSAGALGRQTVPVYAWLDTPPIALGVLGRAAATQADTFARCLQQAEASPSATEVALARPHAVVAAAADWPLLLAIVDWVAEHPRPGVHIRQVPVSGVHTKLVAQHEALLSRLLDARLPDTAIDPDAGTFTGRFGFTAPDRHVLLAGRWEVLGLPRSTDRDQPGPSTAVAFWPLTALQALDPPAVGIDTLLVTENKLSAETAPHHPAQLVLWGSGNEASSVLAALPWLHKVRVRYWGDVDTHGLAILGRVRQVAPHVEPVLMDLATLHAHQEHWVVETTPTRSEQLPGLTAAEAELYRLLRDNVFGDRVRLEQEFIRFDRVVTALATGPPLSRPVPVRP